MFTNIATHVASKGHLLADDAFDRPEAQTQIMSHAPDCSSVHETRPVTTECPDHQAASKSANKLVKITIASSTASWSFCTMHINGVPLHVQLALGDM